MLVREKPPTMTYLYNKSIIALWTPSGTAVSFSKHDFTELMTASLIPFAQRNSSKSNGYMSTMVSYPTGTESWPSSCFFLSLPYPLTSKRDPVAMTSKLPSRWNDFKDVLASLHSCISSAMMHVFPFMKRLPGIRAERLSMIVSTSRFPEKADFLSGSRIKFK